MLLHQLSYAIKNQPIGGYFACSLLVLYVFHALKGPIMGRPYAIKNQVDQSDIVHILYNVFFTKLTYLDLILN